MQTTVPITGRCMSIEAMEALNELRQTKQLCDASLILENGNEIPIHSALFCACSSYFRAYFTTALRNKNENKLKIIGVSPEIMLLLIDYIYLRKLALTEENVYDVLIASDYLSILGALEMCCTYLTKILDYHNAIGIYVFSKAYFCNNLETTVWNFIMKHFVQISQNSEELYTLSAEEFKKILNSDNLNVKSEETVWEAILKWINFNSDERKIHIISLLKCIRLGLLETQYFLQNVKEHPYVSQCSESRPIVMETLTFLYDIEQITQKDGEMLTPEIARPRLPHEVLFVIGGWSGGSPTNYIETYDTRADRWVKVDEVDPQGPRAYHGTVVIGLYIYIIGGFDGMDYFNSCRCFNPTTKIWKEIAPMHARRCYVSTAVLDNIIYAMGGYDGHHRQNTSEKYDYKTNQWSMIGSMNMQRSDASACTLNAKIYVTGGFNGQECMSSAEVYDPEFNQWTLISPMRSRRSGVSCISYHGYIYVIGGFNGISRMCSGEKYNPETNSWSSIPDMYNPRSNFAIEVADDMIFVIGGFNGVTTIYHVECYDDRTNEWYEATDMNIYRSALSACVVECLPNITDYIHKHRDKLMEEKRQKMIALENQRQEMENVPPVPPVPPMTINIPHLNILQQLNNQNAVEHQLPQPQPEQIEIEEDIDTDRNADQPNNNNNNDGN